MKRFAVTLAVAALGCAQTLPSSTTAASAGLAFHVMPVSGKGSLGQQVAAGVEQLQRAAGKSRIVKVRAFVAGSVDATNVPTAIAAEFTKRKLPLPALSVIRVGALEQPSALVGLESVEDTGGSPNPNGVVFVSGQLTTAPKAPNPTAVPLAEKSLANLKTAFAGFQVEPGQVLRITCFASTLVDQTQVRTMIQAQFPSAAANLVQIQKDPENQEVECEAVGRLSKAPASPAQLVNPTNAAFAQAVLFNAPQLIFTTTFTGAATDDGMRAAFRALGNTLQQAGAAFESVYYVYGYPTSATMLTKYRDIRWEFLKREKAPASTNLAFEGMMNPADGFGLDVIALPAK